MALIEFDRVGKAFGSVQALRDVSFRCSDGDILVVFGPPSSGKSTLLRAIAGLEAFDAGTIRFDGQPQNDIPTHRRNVAMAFESYALYPHFTVRKNMEFPLRAPGIRVTAGERATRLAAIAELLAIPHLLDRYPHQLSGGQRQRVSLGRALIRTANVTLLDEPLAHLDAQLRSALRGDLRVFLKDKKATTLYATPDFQEGFGIANRVLVLIEGRIHQIGTPEDVFARPADAHVARLVGDPAMNLIPVGQDGVMQLGTVRVATPLGGGHGPAAAQVGFRPGGVVLTSGDVAAGPTGRVVLIERIGSSSVLDVDVGGATVAVKVDSPIAQHRIGDRVGISFDWRNAHLFGVDAGRLPDAAHAALAAGASS